VIRLSVVLVVPILLGLLVPGVADAADAEPKSYCELKTTSGETREVECPMNASGATQRFAFKTNFSGGHDDTTASMIASLDGLPLTCDEGSKTTLMGEDGDVSLECKFSVRARAGTRLVLKVLLSWRHAEYSDFEFRSD
jgi:cytoskeletal protein RodZ